MGDVQESAGKCAEMIACLARAGRYRDEETAEHVERMSRSCALIARVLGFGAVDCDRLRLASTVHDIGKIGVPDAVLRKPGPLDSQERAMIERHAEIGHQILSTSRQPVMQLAATIALSHHERVDGRGYPRGLAGWEIPLSGRIAAVADVFDALTHDRVYRPAMSVAEACSILHEGRGVHFDARVLDAFEIVLPEVVEIRTRFPEEPNRDLASSATGATPVLLG